MATISERNVLLSLAQECYSKSISDLDKSAYWFKIGEILDQQAMAVEASFISNFGAGSTTFEGTLTKLE